MSRPDWQQARRVAHGLGHARLPGSVSVALDRALGRVLAVDVRALSHVPPSAVSAMDGWAVAGEPPWSVQPARTDRLTAGQAASILTGAPVPRGAHAVIRTEDARLNEESLSAAAPRAGVDIRPRGEEVAAGDLIASRGDRLTSRLIGLAATVGIDAVHVTVAPRAVLLVTGDELVDHGAPRPGRVRDSLSHLLPAMLESLGIEVLSIARAAGDARMLRDVFAGPYRGTVDLIVTTGGTARSEADHARSALQAVGAQLQVDGVAVRPGGPALLAAVPDGPLVACLPGNPLAATAAALTLLSPLLDGWYGREEAVLGPVRAAGITAHPGATRLIPATLSTDGTAVATGHDGSGMIRGLARADGFVVVDPTGTTCWLPLP